MFGLGQKHASRVGLKPVKALFSIQIVSVTLPRSTPILDQAVLSVCFERGGKISSTTNITYDKPAFVREVVVEFGQKVELMATLYKDFKTGRYQEKKGVLILREQTKNNRFGHDTYKGWGKCNVNLHDILNEMGFERTRTKEVSWKFDLLNGSVLKIIITSTIMSTGKDADSMSVASYMTEGSEFNSMAASFSHYDTAPAVNGNSNGNNNTSTMPSHSHDPGQSEEEDNPSPDRDNEDSDVEDSKHFSDRTSNTNNTKNGAEVPAVQTSPRTYMGYLFGSAESTSAPPSVRSGGAGGGYRPDQELIVESPPDKRRNYDLSDSDDAHSQHSDEEEEEEDRGEDTKQERAKYEARDTQFTTTSTSSFQGTRSTSSDKRASPSDSQKMGASGKLALQHPQLSGSTSSPATTSSASVKNRFRDLIGRRKSIGGANSAQERDRDSGQESDEQSDTGTNSARSARKSPAMTQYGRSIPSPTELPPPEDIASPGGGCSSVSSKGSPRLEGSDGGKPYKKGFFSRVMKPLKPSADKQKDIVPALKIAGTESSSEPFSPLQPNSANTCTSEASREAFALYDQELRRRGDHVALLERRLAEQTAQHSAQTAELRKELAATALALRKEKIARAALTEVTHKGDDRLAAALSEARDEAANAMAECERLRREMRVLSGELQESRDHETRLRRGQDGEMQMMQEAAQVAASNSVLRAVAEEENLSLVTSLIETKMQNANMFMEMEEVKRENSHTKKRMQVYAQQVASLEVKYAQSQGRNKKNSSYDSD